MFRLQVHQRHRKDNAARNPVTRTVYNKTRKRLLKSQVGNKCEGLCMSAKIISHKGLKFQHDKIEKIAEPVLTDSKLNSLKSTIKSWLELIINISNQI